MVERPRRMDRGNALRLACCNTNDVRGRKLDLEYFLGQHGVDVCFLSETRLNPSQKFRLANYVYHRTDRPTARSDISILVFRGRDNHSVPVPGLTHLKATGIQTDVPQTSDNPCGIPLALPPTDRSGSGPLCWRRPADFTGWRPERYTCRMELSVDHEEGETLA
jgi:hypothetical protein